MFVVIDDQEAKAARIDEATRDWLESQVFPEVPLISEGSNLRRLDEFVSPVKQPVVMSCRTFATARASVAA